MARAQATMCLNHKFPHYEMSKIFNLALTNLFGIHFFPCASRFADCAVCLENYVPRPSNRCRKCSGENRRFAVGFSACAMLLALFVAAMVVSFLLQRVGDAGRQAQNQPRRWWRVKSWRIRNFLAKSIPLSAIRIVVVVMQIVIQVRNQTHNRVRYIILYFIHICRFNSACR